jgi:hypothetical protein
LLPARHEQRRHQHQRQQAQVGAPPPTGRRHASWPQARANAQPDPRHAPWRRCRPHWHHRGRSARHGRGSGRRRRTRGQAHHAPRLRRRDFCQYWLRGGTSLHTIAGALPLDERQRPVRTSPPTRLGDGELRRPMRPFRSLVHQRGRRPTSLRRQPALSRIITATTGCRTPAYPRHGNPARWMEPLSERRGP